MRNGQCGQVGLMGTRAAAVLCVLALVTIAVRPAVLLFRHHFSEWLLVSIGIVLVFAAFALTFLHLP